MPGADTETWSRWLYCPALAAKAWPALWFAVAGFYLNRNDIDEGTLLLSLNIPNDPTYVATSLTLSACLGYLTIHHLLNTNHREGMDRLALAECKPALRQHVHCEYILATVDGRQGSRQRASFTHYERFNIAV